jgi:hypothetical protein
MNCNSGTKETELPATQPVPLPKVGINQDIKGMGYSCLKCFSSAAIPKMYSNCFTRAQLLKTRHDIISDVKVMIWTHR